MTDVSRLRELWERGTTGPWRHAKRDGSHRIDTDGWPVADCGFGTADAALIVAAINSLPALLDEVERLRKVEAAARQVQWVLGEMLDYQTPDQREDWIASRRSAIVSHRSALADALKNGGRP